MADLRWCVLTRRREAALAALAVLAAIFGSSNLPHADLPANVGYLRVNAGKSSHLIIFDADTFETYRRVKFPPSYTAHSTGWRWTPRDASGSVTPNRVGV